MDMINLHSKLDMLPDELKKQVEDFINSLLEKEKILRSKNERTPGLAKGLIKIKPGFDDPIQDFKDYM